MKILKKNENYTHITGKGKCHNCNSEIEAAMYESVQEGSGALGYYWETKEKCPICYLSNVTINFPKTPNYRG